LKLENKLRSAIEQQQLRTQYQPIVSLRTGGIVAFEALVRWQQPRVGLVSPADFIQLAEESGLIEPLGEWVLRDVCRQIRVWEQEFPTARPFVVSVNVSGRQFKRPDFVSQIDRILEETGVRGSRLAVEITEAAILEDTESAIASLLHLRARRIAVHIDDFGTGYSSLDRLRQLPVDTLKIDRSFVNGLGGSRQNTEFVRAIV